MGTPITDLVSGIETKAGAYLGSTFSKLSYGIDLALNRARGAAKGYAVLPEPAYQENSIGALVVNQDFKLRLTDTFMPGKVNDHDTQTITNSLYDKVYSLYEYLVTEKCGKPALVLNTFDLNVGIPEYSENVVSIDFTFTVKHRLNF